MHLVKATMIRTNADPNNGVITTDEIIGTNESLEVPNLIITGNDEFISQ